MNTPPVRARRDGAAWLLELTVQPGAKATAVVGEHGGRLKLTIMVVSTTPEDEKTRLS